jgi:hypothetical protein
MICSRCGDVVIERGSTLEVSGALRIRALVLCPACSDLFLDWLRSGRADQHARLRPEPSPSGGPARPAVRRLPSGSSNPPTTPAAIA